MSRDKGMREAEKLRDRYEAERWIRSTQTNALVWLCLCSGITPHLCHCNNPERYLHRQECKPRRPEKIPKMFGPEDGEEQTL
jgi:hypothetical protein